MSVEADRPANCLGFPAQRLLYPALNHSGGPLVTSNGPQSPSTSTRYLPLKPSGTRHEYRQEPPQPYSKLPWARILPASSRIFNFGGRGVSSPFAVRGEYCSPA